MYKVPINELKSKIVESGKISQEDLDDKIKAKINELSGLISEEGAAHIIANELNIEVFQSDQKTLKVKEIYAGMRNVETFVKVIQKYDVKEFNKGDRSGKLCALFTGDETDTVRIVLWNDQVDQVSSVKEGDILSIKDAYVKEGLNGQKEVHLGRGADLEINPAGISIEVAKRENKFKRNTIENLQGGEEFVELYGTITQVFDPRFFYQCPTCGKRLAENEGIYTCAEHGTVTPALSYVLNLIFDDGTGNIRSVFWKNQTNKLLTKNEEDLAQYKEDMNHFEDVKTNLLGEQFCLMGRVKRNEMFDRLEFSVQMVEKADPEKEAARLEKENS